MLPLIPELMALNMSDYALTRKVLQVLSVRDTTTLLFLRYLAIHTHLLILLFTLNEHMHLLVFYCVNFVVRLKPPSLNLSSYIG